MTFGRAAAVALCLMCAVRTAQAQSAEPAAAAASPPPLTSTAPPMAPEDVLRVRQLTADIHRLELRRSEAALALPVATIVAGAAVLGVGIGVAAAHSGNDDAHCPGDAPCIDDDVLPFLAGSLTAAVGAGIVAVGTVWTVSRVRARRTIAAEIRAKEDEMILVGKPRAGFVPKRDGGGLFTLAGSF
jgi:hypothetical protein